MIHVKALLVGFLLFSAGLLLGYTIYTFPVIILVLLIGIYAYSAGFFAICFWNNKDNLGNN